MIWRKISFVDLCHWWRNLFSWVNENEFDEKWRRLTKIWFVFFRSLETSICDRLLMKKIHMRTDHCQAESHSIVLLSHEWISLHWLNNRPSSNSWLHWTKRLFNDWSRIVISWLPLIEQEKIISKMKKFNQISIWLFSIYSNEFLWWSRRIQIHRTNELFWVEFDWIIFFSFHLRNRFFDWLTMTHGKRINHSKISFNSQSTRWKEEKLRRRRSRDRWEMKRMNKNLFQ